MVTDKMVDEINYIKDMEKYGFPADRRVKLNPIQNYQLPIKLSDERQAELNKIFRLKEANLNDLLESVGKLINDSFEYGDKSAQSKCILGKFPTYKPNGTETAKGICRDAGAAIIDVLQALRPKGVKIEPIGCGDVPSEVGMLAHRCIVVYDTAGRWAVVNTKSPKLNRQFNLVPKDGLAYMGPPFVPHQKYFDVIKNNLTAWERGAYSSRNLRNFEEKISKKTKEQVRLSQQPEGAPI